MQKVKWGIIGVGDVTEVKSGPAFSIVENSEILSVMRRDFVKVKDYAFRHSIKNYTINADEVLNNKNINAIYIATPPSSHAEYAIKAAQAGKHVYVEKPMATTFKECKRMIEVSRENNVKLFVAYYRRELDYFKKIKRIVDSGTIGKIKSVNIKLHLSPKKDDYQKDNLPWRVNKNIAGGGYFYDLASHQFDYLDFVLGPIESAKGVSTNQANLYRVEDAVNASFLWENKVIGSGSWLFTVEEGEEVDTTEIVGSKGKLVFSFFSANPIKLHIGKNLESIQVPYPKHVQLQLIDKVVKDILGQAKCTSTGESAIRTNWVLEQILYT